MLQLNDIKRKLVDNNEKSEEFLTFYQSLKDQQIDELDYFLELIGSIKDSQSLSQLLRPKIPFQPEGILVFLRKQKKICIIFKFFYSCRWINSI